MSKEDVIIVNIGFKSWQFMCAENYKLRTCVQDLKDENERLKKQIEFLILDTTVTK
jgi:hypothetical protein